MVTSTFELAVAVLFLTWGGPIRPQLGEGSNVRCAFNSNAAIGAAAELRQLDRQVHRIRSEGAAVSGLKELKRVLDGPCFDIARREFEAVGPLQALALSHWWETGGREWMQSQVERVPGVLTEGEIIFPPDPAHVATKERMGRLGQLLCLPFDGRCGEDTAPWLERAQREFEAFEGAASPDYYEGVCEKSIQPLTPETRYATWRMCIEGWRRRVPTVPLGLFRPPERGWIAIVEGGVGHGCSDEVRRGRMTLLGLADGTVLSASGAVSEVGKGPARKVTVSVGRFPRPWVQEIGLALALAPLVVNQRRFEAHELPSDVPVVWTPVAFAPPYVRTGVSIETPPTSWKWLDRGSVIAEGAFPVDEVRDVRGPDANRGHVIGLVEAAFASFQPGCVAAPPYSVLTSRGQPFSEAAAELVRAVEVERKALCLGGDLVDQSRTSR